MILHTVPTPKLTTCLHRSLLWTRITPTMMQSSVFKLGTFLDSQLVRGYKRRKWQAAIAPNPQVPWLGGSGVQPDRGSPDTPLRSLKKVRDRLTHFCFFDPLWVFSLFSADLSLEWLESRESTDSLDLPRLRSLSLCFLRRSISRRRSTGSSLYFPSACQERVRWRFWEFPAANSTTPWTVATAPMRWCKEHWGHEASPPSLGGMQAVPTSHFMRIPQSPNLSLK